jgi:ABC-type Fe3+-hydroxamate transport system substrate-binding protein
MTSGPDDLAASSGTLPVILVVGNLRSWNFAGRSLPDIEGFHFSGFQNLSSELLAELHPDLILSPLMAENFDATDLARLLQAVGYLGAYRAVTNELPNPRVVVTEVRGMAPAVDFDLFILSRIRGG